MKTPCDDYVPTSGVIFFARLVEKVRLKDQGLLPPGYNVAGCPVWDCFDARFCRFFGVEPERLLERIRQGGSNEQILQWCWEEFGRPNQEKILYWNCFITKRGWRDDSSEELEETKRADGLGNRTDVQTWVDYHDVDEGRTPRWSQSR